MASYYKYGTNLGDRTYFTSTVSTSKGTKRYFSNVESEIYFGDKEMDDIYKFDFAIDEKVLPIYGYNCFYPSELVSGQRIIQGQFIVNFTDRKLIQDTLSSIDDSVYTPLHTSEYNPGGGRDHAIWDKNFDIMLGYGYYNLDNETYNATCQTIVGAKISGMQKVTDTTGQPLLEVFNFVAKDFIEEEVKKKEQSSNNNNDKDNNNTADMPNDLKYVCSDAYNNTEITKNNKYCKTHEKCKHFIHNINFNNPYMTMNVIGGNKEKVVILDGNITITEQIKSDIVIPKMQFTSTSKSVATIDLKKQYADIFNKLKKNGTKRIKCTVTYNAKVTSNNTEEMKITYHNAYIYL